MDYRGVDIARDAAAKARPGFVPGKPRELQIPRARCTLVDNRLTLHLSPLIGPHADFVRWVADVVMRAHEPGPHAPTYDVKLNLFGNVPFFDADGTFCREFPKTLRGCAVLVEFRGWWYAGTASGPRWHVLQVREAEPPDAFGFV